MRNASTAVRTELIQQILFASNKQAAALILQVYVNGAWQQIDDLDTEGGVKWSDGGKRTKVNNYAQTPLPGTVEFSVWNDNGQYSLGSGTAVENIFDLDTKMKLKAGYVLSEAGVVSNTSINLNDVSGLKVKSFYHHTEYTGGYVAIDPASITTPPMHFLGVWNFYDSLNYDSATYSPDAYTVHTYDAEGIGFQDIRQFTLTANNTAGDIYYRTFNSHDDINKSFMENWTEAGKTVNGTKTVTVNSTKRFMQVAVMYDGLPNWSVDYRVTDITVTHAPYVEMLYESVYYLDDAEIDDPPAPEMSKVFCSGRDNYKKALNTRINIQDLTAGVKLDVLIKSVCDLIQLPYTASSIADLTDFGDVTWADGFGETITADEIFDKVMKKISTVGYQMFIEYDSTTDDNVLYLKQKPDAFIADGAFSYKNYNSLGATKRDYNKLLQRITVLSDRQSVDVRVELDSDTYNSTGAKSLSWVGNAIDKTITIDKPEDITITDLEVFPTKIEFTVTAITGNVTVTVEGCKFVEQPEYQGEAINLENMLAGKGATAQEINEFVTSDADAKEVAEALITIYGNPVFEGKNLVWPYLNLLPEINDLYLMWRRFIFTDNLFFITKVNYEWALGDSPKMITSFNLDDSGNKFSDQGDFIYDDIMIWDRGYVWDMGISTPLSTNAEIDAASVLYYNVGFSEVT